MLYIKILTLLMTFSQHLTVEISKSNIIYHFFFKPYKNIWLSRNITKRMKLQNSV